MNDKAADADVKVEQPAVEEQVVEEVVIEEPVAVKIEEPEPEPEPAEEQPEDTVEEAAEDEDEKTAQPITPEELKDRGKEIIGRGKEVALGPFWEAGRKYLQGFSDGANAVLDGILGKKK